MVRVLLQGMSGLSLRLPEVADQLTQATVPLDLKREVVQSAVEQAGFAVLPLLGRGLHKLAMEPTHLALTAGRSASSMLVRWQRLERYIHSEHRIQWWLPTPTSARVKHTQRQWPTAFGGRGLGGVWRVMCFVRSQRSAFGQSHG